VPGAAPGKANFVANDPTNSPVNSYVARVDDNLGTRDRFFARLLAQTDTTTVAALFPNAGADPFGYLTHNYYYNASGTWNHDFSAATLNELRVNFTSNGTHVNSSGVGSNLNQQLGLTGVEPTYFSAIAVNGYQQLGNVQQNRTQSPVYGTQTIDNFTLIRGAHQIKFGGEVRTSYAKNINAVNAGGSYTFNNVATGNSIASLLLGWVAQGSVAQSLTVHTLTNVYGAYVQDDWHVTPRLVLNLGVRYDLDEPRTEKDNQQNGFDPLALNPVSGTPGIITFSGRNGVSRYSNHWDLNNFGPRLGFAWNPAENWVVRGGGGILYTPEYYGANPIGLATGFSGQGTFVSPDNGKTAAFLLFAGMPAVSAPTEAQRTAGYGAVPVGTRPNTSVTFMNPDRSTGYLYQATLDLQRQFKGDLLVDLEYVGTFGLHLSSPNPQSINQVPTSELGPGNAQVRRPFPQFSNVQILEADIGASNYNGVNLGVEKRYSHGLQLKANYTYAKFIDNVSSANELANYPAIAFTNYYDPASDRGLSGNDIRHRFVISAVYELPIGGGRAFQARNGVLNAMTGGWSIGAVSEVRSGTPLSPIELTNNTGSFSDGVRPNLVGDPNLPGGRSQSQQLLEWFNVNAFAAPASFTFGNAGRTFGEGPGAMNLDTSLLKDIRVAERVALQFRAEALNVLNHANFANPDTRRGSPTFGQITSLMPGNQARTLQLGLHLQF
jgi:TonB dependent receptor